MKKIRIYLLAILFLFLLLFGFFGKNRLNNVIGDMMQEQLTLNDTISITQQIDAKYNYSRNGQDFGFTLLEFSSTGCTICKQMEPVLEEVRNSEFPKVNVVFLHIMNSGNLDLMKYYGISAVPMQILLDKQGKEFFRHYGFISADDIFSKANSLLSTN